MEKKIQVNLTIGSLAAAIGEKMLPEVTAFVGKDPAKAKMAKDFISHVNNTAEEGAGMSRMRAMRDWAGHPLEVGPG